MGELFLQLALKIDTRAEKKADKELTDELKKVRGKEAMMLRVTEAALSEPVGTVRKLIYPVVGGEKTLQALAAKLARQITQDRTAPAVQCAWSSAACTVPDRVGALKGSCRRSMRFSVIDWHSAPIGTSTSPLC
ncbi:hypothetical protein [Streptomyces sp. NPDC096013]|uniref:hypothetical protein n=1 Tax=Streptomyces sp. NPDC096013 TaxID=3366069 RepID=UPI00380496BD